MQQFVRDTSITCEVYKIESYETSKRAYEGHYLHSDITVEKSNDILDFYKGDFIIPMSQIANRYIVETLEPESSDSFFAWNFFDEILQQKEWYSPYVFEDKAVEILKKDTDLKKRYDDKLKNDEEFANNPRAQLYFIYMNS